MKQNESCGLYGSYEAPQAELLEMIFGQSILISGSGTLPDGIDEGDEDTFLPSLNLVNLFDEKYELTTYLRRDPAHCLDGWDERV